MTDAKPVTVRGGSGGIEAHCDEMIMLARQYGAAGLDVGEQGLVLHGYLLHPAVVAAGALDPVGAADFSAELVAALDGPAGLTRRAIDFGLLAAGLRAAALTYQQADQIEARTLPTLRAFVEAGPALVQTVPRLVDGDFGGALDTLVANDPGLGDLAVNAATSFWTNYRLINMVAAGPDGRALVTAMGEDPGATSPPRNLGAVLSGLARRNRGSGGDIDVRVITGPGATRRVIVDIPGTKSWSARPDEPDVTSAGTNLRAISGRRTTYQQGVLEALRRAGVTASDEVMLVGHSQGGLVAVNTATATTRTREFNVTHVISVGAPIARLPVARPVKVLAIENDGDVVPHSDGATNPDRRNITTVTVHRNHGELHRNHSLEHSYLPGAEDITASTDESVRAYLESVRPYLGGDQVTTKVFHIERRWPN